MVVAGGQDDSNRARTMVVFVKHVAVEFAATVSPGAVLGFVSGLLPTPEQADRRNRRQAGRRRRRGPVVAAEAGPYQERACNGPRSWPSRSNKPRSTWRSP